MAVLNKIRQRSLFLILIIALALFAFVLSDLFRNSDALSAKSQNVVATINGKDISREDFLMKVENATQQMGGQATQTQVMNRVWEQEVRSAILEKQFEELGITVERDQMRDLLRTSLGSNPDFQNEAGVFDDNKLTEYIANLKATSAAAYQQWIEYENSIAANALQQNYFNLVKASMVGTLAEGKLEHQLEGNNADIKFVQVAYSTIADSTITVSKSEIEKYMKNHKKEYEVEESIDLQYVQFREAASTEDEAEIEKEIAKYKTAQVEYVNGKTDTIPSFANAKDNANYINFVANSEIKFADRFIKKSALPDAVADDVYNLNVGEVFGPYKENGFIKLTKVVAVTQLPDSVKARHILIPFVGSRSQTEVTTQTEVQAKKTADSLMTIIKKDKSKFVSLLDFSVDTGTNEKEGIVDWFTYDTMVPEFRDFAFENEKGNIDVVKTDYGFHVIEILDQTSKKRVIKIGTIAKTVEPSEQTVNKVFRDASNFEIDLADKNFGDLAKERDYTARPVNTIKVLDETIPGLGNQRNITRWAFESGTKTGDVKRFNVAGGYAIVQLVAKNKAGMMKTEDASVTALPAIRMQKKAELIKSRISATTLEDVAAAENTSVRSSLAINMKNPTISGAGNEPKVVGYAFGLKVGETSKLIDGEKGVYMIRVEKLTPAAELDNYQGFANKVQMSKINTVESKLFPALKEVAEIEDNRANTVQ
ncbi:peptidylprolyl isomerase [Bizionia argentinensis JUB59]|uniref:Periplasmic chaperone PpiD n=1 Tax=Bizionia argentinensis JUB59 TaxID=1046627 RepID=G2EDX4_9FLAO|nr:peptidylprolyl isomerase [Bizionia argentinensis]EGV43349.1 peptidylprolyl isomerase [Bizionia argentinensis JUB59]